MSDNHNQNWLRAGTALFIIFVMVGAVLVVSGPTTADVPSPELASKQMTRAGGAGFVKIGMQDDMKTVNTVIAQDVWDWNVLGWTSEGLYNKDKNEKIIPWMMDNQKGDDDPETGFKTGYVFDIDNPKEGRAWIKTGIFWVQGFDGELSRIPRNCDPTLPWDASNPDPNACEQVTAADLVFTYNYLKCAPRYQNALDPLRIEINVPGDPCDDELGVKVMDDDPMGLEFTLARTTASFVKDILGWGPYHQATWTAHEAEKLTWQPKPTDIPNIGPMLFASDDHWRRDQSVRLTTNPYYFPNDYGLLDGPFLDGIQYVIYKNTDTAVLALQNGDIDFIAWTIPPGYIPNLLDTPEVTVEQSSELGFFYSSFNFRNPALGYDSRGDANRVDVGKPLRQAIAHSTDKIAIVNRLLQNYGTIGDSAVSPANAEWYNESVKRYDFNPQLARQILDENGYQMVDGWYRSPNGDPIDGPGGNGEIEIITPPADYDPIRAQAGLWIAENLKAVGINAVAKPLDFGSLVVKVNEHTFEMYLLGWSIGGDEPDYMYDFFRTDPLDIQGGYNSHGYSNPEYDVIVDEMVQSLDRDRRIELNKEAQGIIAEDLVYNVLYYRDNIEAYRNDKFEGWYVKELGGVFNQWTIYELREISLPTEISVSIVDPNPMVENKDQTLTFKVVDRVGQPQAATIATLNEVQLDNPGASITTPEPVPGQDGIYTATFTAPSIDGDDPIFVRICATAHDNGLDLDSGRTCESVKVFPTTATGIIPTISISKTLYATEEVQLAQLVTVKVLDLTDFPVEGAAIEFSWSTEDAEVAIDNPIEYTQTGASTDAIGEAESRWAIASPPSADSTYILTATATKEIDSTIYTESSTTEFRVLGLQDTLVATIVQDVDGTPKVNAGADHDIKVMVTSHRDGTPVEGVKVEVIEVNPGSIESILQGDYETTGADGIAIFTLNEDPGSTTTVELTFQATKVDFNKDSVTTQVVVKKKKSPFPFPAVIGAVLVAIALMGAAGMLRRRG